MLLLYDYWQFLDTCRLCVYVASYDFKTKYWTDETYGHDIILLLMGGNYPNLKGLN